MLNSIFMFIKYFSTMIAIRNKNGEDFECFSNATRHHPVLGKPSEKYITMALSPFTSAINEKLFFLDAKNDRDFVSVIPKVEWLSFHEDFLSENDKKLMDDISLYSNELTTVIGKVIKVSCLFWFFCLPLSEFNFFEIIHKIQLKKRGAEYASAFKKILANLYDENPLKNVIFVIGKTFNSFLSLIFFLLFLQSSQINSFDTQPPRNSLPPTFKGKILTKDSSNSSPTKTNSW